ncbi:hypothetical protein [Gracilimonas sp.]|uniref:hypothetical protein n=1 Tax=Gracilimonas sp. TaxID=1974203 RepID=UPI0032EE963D
MSLQSYKITVEGVAELHNVSCVLEFINIVPMKPVSSKKWEGSVTDIEVNEKLDYKIIISATGRVKFDYEILNTKVEEKVKSDTDYTNRNIPNGAIVNGNCKAE